MKWQAVASLTLLLPMLGCNYTKLKDPNGNDNTRFSLPADQRGDLSYGLVARRVLIPKCVSCHGTSGGVSLETYSDALRHLDGIKKTVFETRSMPKQGTLNDQEMSILWTWMEMGAPENAGNGEPDPQPPPLEGTYTSIAQNILQPKCVSCHSPGNSAARIPLSEESLLNSPLELAIPGNPDESGLVIAVERTDDKRMPPAKDGYAALKNEEKAAIRAWIEKLPLQNPPDEEADPVIPTVDSLNDRAQE